jgi:hypothetical protein
VRQLSDIPWMQTMGLPEPPRYADISVMQIDLAVFLVRPPRRR